VNYGHKSLRCRFASFNVVYYKAFRNLVSEKPMTIRRLMLFVWTYRKARRLGFTPVDAMRAARVNSLSA